MSEPIFSIIIVNWNGAAVLPRCLQSIQAQTCQDYELILVDNGSRDGSVDAVEKQWPDIELIRLNSNLGFAQANNIGAQQARAPWLILLNNDAFPTSGWLETLASGIRSHPGFTMFASRLLVADSPERIDGTGDAYHVSGTVWNRQHRYPVQLAEEQLREVFSPQGAAALIRRDAFEQARGFDENYFSYHEDIDLGFRLRLLGHRCLYLPEAVVHHKGSHTTGKGSDFAVRNGHRNWVWCYFQNMPSKLFWTYLPQHLLANLFFIFYISSKGQARAILRAKWDALTGLPAVLKRRQAVQAARTVSDQDLLKAMERGLLTPYLLGYRARQLNRQATPNRRTTTDT